MQITHESRDAKDCTVSKRFSLDPLLYPYPSYLQATQDSSLYPCTCGHWQARAYTDAVVSSARLERRIELESKVACVRALLGRHMPGLPTRALRGCRVARAAFGAPLTGA